jgi:hypothetical protein
MPVAAVARAVRWAQRQPEARPAAARLERAGCHEGHGHGDKIRVIEPARGPGAAWATVVTPYQNLTAGVAAAKLEASF